MKRKVTVDEVREIAKSLGFKYRASGVSGQDGSWVTFTYPGTNTYIVHIDLTKPLDIMQTLALELVRCGRIQQRQALLREVSPFNYN